MSVSDPLLKILKGHILQLRLSFSGSKITDHHPSLQPLCETLENIFRKGLKQSTSILKLYYRDYYDVFKHLANYKKQQIHLNEIDNRICLNHLGLVSGKFDLAFEEVMNSKRVFTNQGRGRLMIRALLNRGNLSWPIGILMHKTVTIGNYYDDLYSILGNEILAEIFLSLLKELDNVMFELDMMNASFLDDTWLLPQSVLEEYVPCSEFGLQMVYIEEHLVIEHISPGSVAAEDNKIIIGDILDELCGVCLKRNFCSLRDIMRTSLGKPLTCRIIRCTLPIHCSESPQEAFKGHRRDPKLLSRQQLYPPLIHLLKRNNKEEILHSCRKALTAAQKDNKGDPNWPDQSDGKHTTISTDQQTSFYALLDDEFPEEVNPVDPQMPPYHVVRFVGQIQLGSQGGVSKIENAIADVLRSNPLTDKYANVRLHLGEKDLIVCDLNTGEQMLNHAFPQISACGRRIDCPRFFAYIAGESTCGLSRDFQCFVFQARNVDDSKTILFAVAQGFDRTHWAL